MASSPQPRPAGFPLPTEFEAIVFDCDGLLVDTETCWSRAESALFREHGHPFGTTQKQLVIGRTVEGVGEVMAAYFDRPGDGKVLASQLLDGVRRELAGGAAALPGAADLVRTCAERLPVAVASNSPRSLLDTALESSGLADLLPVSFAADEVPTPKPAPDLYLAACEALGAAPTACVAFEDSNTGIRAARAAGLRLVTVPSLAGQDLDHDWLLGSLADPGLHAWARALRQTVTHPVD
ncbi:HAD family hydrolase [Streptomyces monomycini]|uniref:HAD family hydrolase n=1 Tax=Streptomyces monomycini TaxID=371720 RepID=UPI001EECDFBC|nr:HAD family phosphatase [Streptomyces monomycini]